MNLGINYEKKYKRLRRFVVERFSSPKHVITEHFRALAECSQDVVFLVDKWGKIIMVNHAATKVCGFHRDEIIGRHFRIFLTLDDLSEGFKIFYRTLRGESTEATRLRVKKKDGSTTVLELSGTPVVVNGKFLGGLAIARDIGARMAQESQDRIRAQTFAKLVADCELHQKELETLRNELTRLRTKLQQD